MCKFTNKNSVNLHLINRPRRFIPHGIRTKRCSGPNHQQLQSFRPRLYFQHTVHNILLIIGLRNSRPIRQHLKSVRGTVNGTYRNSKKSFSSMSHVFSFLLLTFGYIRFPLEIMAPSCTTEQIQVSDSNGTVWTFLGLHHPRRTIYKIYMDVQYVNIIADQVHPFSATVLFNVTSFLLLLHQVMASTNRICPIP